MVRLSLNIIMALIVVALVWILSVICTGCSYTKPVAQKQFGRAVSTFQEIGAEYCREKYPVTSRTDSAGYKASLAVIDSLEREISDAAVITESERAALLQEIQRVRETLPAPSNCDSLSEPLFRLAAKERQRGDELARLNRELVKAAANLKPIRDTVIDKAALHASQLANKDCQDAKDRAIRLLEAKTKEAESLEQKAKNRWWMIVGLLALNALQLVLFFRKKVKP